MTDEDGFLRALLASPSDATTRLVYADWLDDQTDPLAARKSAFIRLETRLAGTPERSLNHLRFVRHLQQIAAGLAPDWLATVGHPALEACRLRFQSPCPARWDRLSPTADPRARHCGSCDRVVHHCDTLNEARRYAAAGECVAVSSALVRRPADLFPGPPQTGSLRPGTIRLSPEVITYLRRSMTMIGLPEPIPAPAPSGPGIRPAKRDEHDDRPRRLKPDRRARQSKHIRFDEFED
ncbi:MAG TPA: TIGR02996 domain-containing protein [Urbifossiella sp.]|jgi:uncharacterized protein (TIGR02996 family)|nr:TIGR02996 domain-containing protein [Urbifossiella sp.]